MDLGLFKEQFLLAHGLKKYVHFICRCRVKYSGRAEASIGLGDRSVILKQDGTVLTHRPYGGNPVNYMRRGAIPSFEQLGNILFLKIYHPKTKELLSLEIHSIHHFYSQRLSDEKKQLLAGTERDMSDWVKDNPHVIHANFKPLSREEHTKFGFIDVFGHDGDGNLVIVECKKFPAGLSAVQQLRRYVEKIKDLKGIEKVRGVLASPSISDNALDMLRSFGYEHKSVIPPHLTVSKDKSQQDLLGF